MTQSGGGKAEAGAEGAQSLGGKAAKQKPCCPYWPRVLFAAGAYPALLPILRDLHGQSAAVERLATGRLKLAAGSIPPAAWAEACAELEPHREDLIRVLAWAARGYVSIHSRLLDGEVVHLTGDAAWVEPAERRRLEAAGQALYTAGEVERLADLGPAELKAVHQAKRAVGGEVVGDESPAT